MTPGKKKKQFHWLFDGAATCDGGNHDNIYPKGFISKKRCSVVTKVAFLQVDGNKVWTIAQHIFDVLFTLFMLLSEVSAYPCVYVCWRDSRRWHLSKINMHIHGTGDNPLGGHGAHIISMNKDRTENNSPHARKTRGRTEDGRLLFNRAD